MKNTKVHVVHRDVETGYAKQRVWCAVAIHEDKVIIGIGMNREESFEKLLRDVEQATGSKWRIVDTK